MSYYDLFVRARANRQARLDHGVNPHESATARAEPVVFPPDAGADCFGDVLELRVPFLDVTLFFVSTDKEALSLVREGISRGRIWTVNELVNLYQIPNLTPVSRISLASACALFDGEIVNCAKSDESAESPLQTEGGARKARKARKGFGA